jgi:dienelactone hydrolase
MEKLEWALRSWDGDYQSETYEAKHGWMIPGHEVYDPENAQRGFEKLTGVLYDTLQSADVRR